MSPTTLSTTLLALLALAAAPLRGETPWSVRTADSLLARHPDPRLLDSERPKWEYTHGLVLLALLQVAERSHDPRYLKYVKTYYDGMIDAQGQIRTYALEEYNIDRLNPGKALVVLYQKTGDEKYRKALQLLREQIRKHPRTSEGGFWHKQRYPSQMWLDGLYMGAPFLAQYAQAFGEPRAFDDVVTQFVLMEKHARDPKSGLMYHGWDESRKQKWADPQTGLSRCFWGRAMGWYAMGLVEALDFVPRDHPRRAELVAILDRLAEAVARVQNPRSGVWYQVLDQPAREGNYLEASVSAMFSYALLKAARLGYVGAKYGDVGRRAYAGLLKEFVELGPDGLVNVHRVCQVAGLGGDPERERFRDGTFEYYVSEKIRSNDPKAVGPFIFASLEMELRAPGGRITWRPGLGQPADWYASEEALRVADNLLLYQRSSGGWPKDVDMARPLEPEERARVLGEQSRDDATIDNGATFTQLRYLGRVLAASNLPRLREAWLRGFDYLLAAQYPNGGWPQFFPLRSDYSRHITFNDGAMIGVLRLSRDVSRGPQGPFAFVDRARRQAAARAVALGQDLILRAQVRVGGRLTVWCAQHDELTLEPRGARAYELPSLSGKESVGILEYLLEVPQPEAAVVAAVEAAAAWLQSVRIEGQRVERVAAPGPAPSAGEDVALRPAAGAPSLWARFYEIGSNRPLFVGRDGVPHYALAEIEQERRVGYHWVGPYAAELLAQRLPEWRARLGTGVDSAANHH